MQLKIRQSRAFRHYASRSRLASLSFAAMALIQSGAANAIGADSDGFITPQPGHPMALLYQLHNTSSEFFSDGHVATSNAQFTADVTLLRYVHPIQLGGDVIATPNIIVPLAHLSGDGELSGLGSRNGMGDTLLVFGLWPIHDWEARKHLAIVPFLYLPTGQYDKNAPLNVGENRYKAALQVGGMFPISESFDFSGSIDGTAFGKNKDTDMKQDFLFEARGWIKYNLKSQYYASTAFGLGYVGGGETKVGGVRQGDRQGTTTAYVQFGTMGDDTKTNHLLFTFAKDIDTRQGLKLDSQFQVRFLHIF